MERAGDTVRATIERFAKDEAVLGPEGGQFRSFDWTFSPRGTDGKPLRLFDRATGAVDSAVAAYWRDHYDIGHMIETNWPSLKRDLDGKVHIAVGAEDSYYLDSAVHRLEAAFRKVGGRADFTYVPGASHDFNAVFARGGDRNAYWKDMTSAMYAVARPASARRPKAS